MLDRRIHVALQVFVGQQHAFGQAGAAAGVEQHGHVVGLGIRELRLESLGGFFGSCVRSITFSGRSFSRGMKKGIGQHGVDVAVLDDVADLLVAQQIIDRHHGLASKQRSVETGDESKPGRQQQPTRGFSVWNDRYIPSPAAIAASLAVGISPVDHRSPPYGPAVLWRVGRVVRRA